MLSRSDVLCLQCVKAASLQKLGNSDIGGILAQAMSNAVSISAPTFFSTSTDLFQDTIAAIQFGFQGVSYSPCAIPVTPLGVGIFPQVWRSSVCSWWKDNHVHSQAPSPYLTLCEAHCNEKQCQSPKGYGVLSGQSHHEVALQCAQTLSVSGCRAGYQHPASVLQYCPHWCEHPAPGCQYFAQSDCHRAI